MSKHTRSGFTLIEIIVVVALIALLTAAGLISYMQANVSSRNSKRQADLEQLKAALVLYRTDNLAYPTSPDTTVPYTTLQPYLSGSTPRDPKNVDPYIYSYSTSNSNKAFSLCATLEPTAALPSPPQYCVTNP